MLKIQKLLIFSVFLLGFSYLGQAQSLDSTLQKLAGNAAKGYVGPIVSGFGSDLNAGWFHKAPAATTFSFDLEFGLVAMGTMFTDANKKFSTSGSFRFDHDQSQHIAEGISNWNLINPVDQQRIIDAIAGQDFTVGIAGPTVIGSKLDTVGINFNQTTITVNTTTGPQSFTIPANHTTIAGAIGVLDGFSTLPLAAPQLSLGTVWGTQFTFRYLPEVEISKEIGKFKYFGFGIQHNPSIWLPAPLPVDVSVGYFTQDLKLGTLFESKATAFGVNASKSFGPGALKITPYAGYMIESSKMTFTYDYTINGPGNVPSTKHISFELEGENKSRLTLGLSLKLGFINLNGDYNLGTYNSVSGGFMFII